uniref:PBP domain-containing protein n=2 Tax=Grammatophora oceanica TaxID=210454 RepID=A0A7S1UPZ1_9STRA|mmetsp:Transcript_14022/g.20529  ORF Transcript_14022/g.20529 Transcript_14022/m.20529 type:complete len:548 (+) Transcript_14022:111-1754(+)
MMLRTVASTTTTTAALLLLLGGGGAPVAFAHEQTTVAIAGSGTTNPSKCYWLIMEQIMDRLLIPTRLTYRAVGSSTGQTEFMGSPELEFRSPANDFGSGDIPLTTTDYNELKEAGIDFVHLPVVLGAISLFHSVPGVPDGDLGLNLTACDVAKIFKREVTTWDDDILLENNPGLKGLLPSTNFPIKVAHRRLGSSSTASVTKYLREGCPGEWPEALVGKVIEWPADTLECEGSGGMTNCIRDNEGTIGYIDAGHGHSENLVEIELKNADGNFLSSKKAAANGGIGAAANVVANKSPDSDFGSVDLLNAAGEFTWPIVAMSYVYVRKDLSYLETPAEQGLLIAFLEALFNPAYINQCTSLFGFTPVPNNIRTDISLAGIAMLEKNTTAAPIFTFENETTPIGGQGAYVISEKRRSYSEYERSTLTKSVGSVQETLLDAGASLQDVVEMVEDLQQELEIAQSQVVDLTSQVNALKGGSSGSGSGESFVEVTSNFGSKEETQLKAALAMSAVSLILIVIGGIIMFSKNSGGGGTQDTAKGSFQNGQMESA